MSIQDLTESDLSAAKTALQAKPNECMYACPLQDAPPLSSWDVDALMGAGFNEDQVRR